MSRAALTELRRFFSEHSHPEGTDSEGADGE